MKKKTSNGNVDFFDVYVVIDHDLSLLGSCSIGELFIKTDGDTKMVSGESTKVYFYVCISSNDWTPVVQD